MPLGHKITSTVNGAGVVTSESNAVGGLNILVEPITTLFNPKQSLIGTAKYVQLGLVAVAGNMLGVKASTNRFGVAITPKLSFYLGE